MKKSIHLEVRKGRKVLREEERIRDFLKRHRKEENEKVSTDTRTN